MMLKAPVPVVSRRKPTAVALRCLHLGGGQRLCHLGDRDRRALVRHRAGQIVWGLSTSHASFAVSRAVAARCSEPGLGDAAETGNGGEVNIFEPDARATSGCVTRNTTTRSSTVDRPSVNAKPFTSPTGDHVQDGGRQEGHGVGGQDGPPGPRPAAWHRGPECSALPDLVLDSFEVDDERVGGDADGDDQTGDAGHVQAQPDPPTEQHHDRVDQAAGQDQRQDGDDAEQPVVEQAVDDHQQQSRCHRRSGRPAGTAEPSWALTLLGLAAVEGQRQGAELQRVGQRRRRCSG